MSQAVAHDLALDIEKVIPKAVVEPFRVGVGDRYIILVTVTRNTRRHSITINNPAEWGLLLAVHEMKAESGALAIA